jgi:hypothetical protein
LIDSAANAETVPQNAITAVNAIESATCLFHPVVIGVLQILRHASKNFEP